LLQRGVGPGRHAGFAVAAFAFWGDHRRSSLTTERNNMAESVYKIIELVGTSTESWEKAAAAAVNRAGKSLRDLRVAEITQLDMTMDNGKVKAYRAKVKVSFKFEGD
jgi:flavin-binding protein dodecin